MTHGDPQQFHFLCHPFKSGAFASPLIPVFTSNSFTSQTPFQASSLSSLTLKIAEMVVKESWLDLEHP